MKEVEPGVFSSVEKPQETPEAERAREEQMLSLKVAEKKLESNPAWKKLKKDQAELTEQLSEAIKEGDEKKMAYVQHELQVVGNEILAMRNEALGIPMPGADREAPKEDAEEVRDEDIIDQETA